MKIENFLKRAFRAIFRSNKSYPQSKTSLVNDYYFMSYPSPQNSVNILKGEWSSKFPEEYLVEAGPIPLFEDYRIRWLVNQVEVEGMNVLELGPLEGGHTYMLEKAQAGKIIAIEANSKAYIKCLITKEITGLTKSSFLCGDFVQYLENTETKFDGIIACGVLYHMTDPVKLIHLISNATTNFVFLWTHYYDQKWVESKSSLERFSGKSVRSYLGFECNYHQQNYLDGSSQPGFCGGGFHYSNWMEREDIIRCLRYFGFSELKINFDDYNHPNGPSFAVLAHKSKSSVVQ